MTLQDITVHGAREHNLRSVNVTIPRLALTTITGVSGSGKSSLAFDTIYQEGQRRYVESLSTYARQFLGRMEKPKVDRVDGLSPALLIDQKTAGRNPRSTVGTITEILDYLRLLFARLGTPRCPTCGAEVRARTVDALVDDIIERHGGERLQVLAPVVRDRKGHYRKDLEGWRLKGHTRAWIDGAEFRLDDPPTLNRQRRHTIELVIDRVVVDPKKRTRLAEAVEMSCELADGLVRLMVGPDEPETWSTRNSCPAGHGDVPELEPRLFSFNSPHGACGACDGLGFTRRPDASLVITDDSLSILDGALKIMNKDGYLSYVRLGPRRLQALADAFDIDLDKPWKKLPKRARDLLMHGSGDEEVTLVFDWSSNSGNKTVKGSDTKPFPGILPAIAAAVGRPGYRHAERFLAKQECDVCMGSRLNEAARAVRFRGESLNGLTHRTIHEVDAFFESLALEGREALVGVPIVKEIRQRLGFLRAVGVGYLGLDRGARTLSGGESQRVRLASQVGSGLQGVLYVLDEPSIGLHPRDNKRLIGTLGELRDRGNTVIVVEHDTDMILASDAMVDIGPGAGREGGLILADGPVKDVLEGPHTLTTDYLAGRRTIAVPETRRPGSGEQLVVRGARQHNLHDLDVTFPLGCLTAVTGVSGSGKSTLVDMILRRALARKLQGSTKVPGEHESLDGVDYLDKVVEIDQKPIGRTPRSNPATYTGVMDNIRDVFANTPEAKMRGYGKGRFSFNVKGGRCEECQGAGVKTIEMQFLPTVVVPCEVCDGRRYNDETLQVTYRDKAIDEILAMTVAEALEFFEHHAKIARILQTLNDVGLAYVSLGQPSTTLSGGEAQRVKLASELCRPATGRTLYILDEPTTGLHMEDIRVLLTALQRLVDAGNTIIVVEHNLDVVKVADWVIDLGPEGGAGGGHLVAEGTPETVAASAGSETGRYLKPLLRGTVKPARASRRRRQAAGAVGNDLIVRGASLHNLQNVDVTIPHGSLTVITGVSGSGKTSLAFDTLFAEGQRRFVESLSTYARRFLERMERPPVEHISGLSPAIAIDQKTAPRNPRSTVSTTTEIHDYLRILFARIGRTHCHTCGKQLRAWSASLAARNLVDSGRSRKAMITAPLFHADECHPTTFTGPERVAEAASELSADGFVRLLVDGKVQRIDALGDLSDADSIELVVDRLTVDGRRRTRLAEAIGQAQRRGLGLARVRLDDGVVLDYEARPSCPLAGAVRPGALEPRMFSFNSPAGACSECDGLGRRMVVDTQRLIDKPHRPLLEGAMTSRVGGYIGRAGGWHRQILERLAERHGVDLALPWSELPDDFRSEVLGGSVEGDTLAVAFEKKDARRSRSYEYDVEWQGLLEAVAGWWRNTEKDGWWRRSLESLLQEGACPQCKGGRLRPESLAVTIADRSIHEISQLTVDAAAAFVDELTLQGEDAIIAVDALQEIANRLGFLRRVGLGYLALDRPSSTLSGGEAQRIRLASQLGNRLVGVLYVLDEPSIGLHPRDQRRLLDTLEELRDLGNTIVVVEHDRDTMEVADHLIDMGPGAGISGGKIVAAGTPAKVKKSRTSLTGRYLSGRRAVPIPTERRSPGRHLTLKGASLHNLRNVTARFPLGALTVVTGVSGSGKSSLVGELLVPAVTARLEGDEGGQPREMKGLTGVSAVDKLLVIDQAPIGRSPHSNAATYTGAMDDLRMIFAQTSEARMRGFGPGRFSTNVAGGRCETCQGRGVEVIEMHFLSDVEVPCEACGGRRYGRQTLEVRYKGHSIADVLEMEVRQVLEVFGHHSAIRRKLGMLDDVGLGYLKLGQPATTLSGGEAQRMKLAAELGRPGTGRSLIVLDEPTTGLHFEDVGRLVDVLQTLVNSGNTVVVIEHNVDVIKSADWIVDLGPEGGAEGGRVVIAGTPEDVARCAASHTGRFLADSLAEAVA